jgi:uncharacterized protein
MKTTTHTAFSGATHIVSGDLETALKRVKAYLDSHPSDQILIFEDETGRQVDFDFRGTLTEVLARACPAKPKSGPGRPKLGVVCGEVALLPRHWEWLERQQHNVSATIRRLVDEASKNQPTAAKARQALEATDREMWTLAGNLPGCEEASRALYARDFERFAALIKGWPGDISAHLLAMAALGRQV